MRNLILVLIAFIAVVTFIRAYEGSGADIQSDHLSQQAAIDVRVGDWQEP
jgi:hypothetical protein